MPELHRRTEVRFYFGPELKYHLRLPATTPAHIDDIVAALRIAASDLEDCARTMVADDEQKQLEFNWQAD
jgi:hypothetical protein